SSSRALCKFLDFCTSDWAPSRGFSQDNFSQTPLGNNKLTESTTDRWLTLPLLQPHTLGDSIQGFVFGHQNMSANIGILAVGSLIDHPGKEIKEVVIGRRKNVLTPFGIEFARSSGGRSGTPTLVPLVQGGNPVLGCILLLNATEQDAKDRLWRREINRVGQ